MLALRAPDAGPSSTRTSPAKTFPANHHETLRAHVRVPPCSYMPGRHSRRTKNNRLRKLTTQESGFVEAYHSLTRLCAAGLVLPRHIQSTTIVTAEK